ncbi:MAG TPA: methyltransferase domain-containing protein [Mycobacteriales bacterium]|nr:methyltransferase domain-containing protein [Mycobacteriales bacterium]
MPVPVAGDQGNRGEADVAGRTRMSASPRLAVVWSVLRAELDQRGAAASGQGRQDMPGVGLSALDVGGGSGMFAVPLAGLGLAVTVVDTSADALATLERRAAEAGVANRVVGVQGDADRLSDVADPASYDLVLCHSVLEVVDDAAATTATIAAMLRPGGCVSMLVANRTAAVFARALSGHLAEAMRVLTDPAGRSSETDSVQRRFDTASLTALLGSAGLVVERLHGVRVVTDLVPGALLDGVPGAVEALHDLELAASAVPPYRDMATQLHALARQAGPPA